MEKSYNFLELKWVGRGLMRPMTLQGLMMKVGGEVRGFDPFTDVICVL